MYQSTQQYIRERQGNKILESVGADVDFVLSHPNGWEGKQQSEMRSAAIAAGLVADMTEGLERISFVTEGEASLHFCLNKIPAALEQYVSLNGITMLYMLILRPMTVFWSSIVEVELWTSVPMRVHQQVNSERSLPQNVTPDQVPSYDTYLYSGLLQGSFFVTQRAQAYLTGRYITIQNTFNLIMSTLQRSSGNQNTESWKI